MHETDEHYYTINISFLKLLGIWPHDKSRLVLLKRVLIIIITTTYIALQLSVFITTKYSMTVAIRVVSIVFPFTIIILKYCVFVLKLKAIKDLHYLIQEDWKIMRNKLENKIMQKYAHIGRYLTVLAFLYIIVIAIVVLILQFLPIILDVILPLDKPRSRNLLVLIEYFVFRDKYFYTKVLHEFVFLLICGSIMFATGTQLLVFICHSLGMLKVASYRVAHTIEDSVLHTRKSKKERTICKRIMHAVIVHRRALEFCNIILSSFNVPYCIIAIFGVLSLSINLFGFVQAATVSKNIENVAICFISAIGHLTYIFATMLAGQKIADYNGELFRVAYNTSWYLTPVKSQKLILFLLQRTGKDYYFTIGFIFVAKIESCATLINAALSYVTMMYNFA